MKSYAYTYTWCANTFTGYVWGNSLEEAIESAKRINAIMGSVIDEKSFMLEEEYLRKEEELNRHLLEELKDFLA